MITREISKEKNTTYFQQKIFSLLLQVPTGKVTSYKELGRKLGLRFYQPIGQALKSNHDSVYIPCYKVVHHDGRIGGYFGNNHKDIATKIEKLKREGIPIKLSTTIKYSRIINFKKYLFQF